MRKQGLRQNLAERETADERDHDPRNRYRGGRTAYLADQLEVRFHSCQQQQQQDAELRDALDQRFLFGRGWKDRGVRGGPEPSEQGRAKQQAAQQFADHGWLTDPLHDFAESASDPDQKRDLGQQQEFGRAG